MDNDIECPNCGSHEVVIYDDYLYLCTDCHVLFTDDDIEISGEYNED